MVAGSRMFDGKKYDMIGHNLAMGIRSARKKADRIRAKGMRARVVKFRDGRKVLGIVYSNNE